MMTLLEKPIYKDGCNYTTEAERSMAFNRLVGLLTENGLTLQTGAVALTADSIPETALGMLSRLRAARAVYALSSNGELARETQGAWMLRHAVV